uniref:Calnexin n=1 Tax=Clastoptera arizonana TaxID=38151 RepID=A0A1B6DDQ8_9HEMI
MKVFISVLIATLLINSSFSDSLEETVQVDDTNDVTVESEDDILYTTPSVPTSGVYFTEHFDDLEKFQHKWVKSEAKKEGIDESISKYDGVWAVEQAVRDPLKNDFGLVLKTKAKHAAISAKLDRPFIFKEKPLVVQYEVMFQEGQECGGAYIKLLSSDSQNTDLKKFHDRTPYTIMFGPDKCASDYKLHFIFRHKNPNNGTLSEKHCKKPKERLDEPYTDKAPHLYTLIVRPDNTFQVYLDHKVVNEGSLLDDFTPPVNPPAEIDDPNDVKPEDWDEREKIPDMDVRKPDDWDETAPQMIKDPSATKPDGWLDDEPENIPDPSAEKPSDWDEEMDGEWEAPLVPNPACEGAPGCGEWTVPEIPNPAYKGKWRPPMIENPNYQGKWSPARIANPEFFEDKEPYKMTPIYAVGLELWSMSNQILFDNFIITENPSIADQWAAQTFDLKKRKMDKDSDSFVNAAWKYTNEHPWLYAVYVVVIGLPLVLIFVFFCTGSPQDKEDERNLAQSKKTDEPVPDDEEMDNLLTPDNVADEPEEEEEEAEAEVKDSKEKSSSEDKEDKEEAPKEEVNQGAGDAPSSPRKRKTRKD